MATQPWSIVRITICKHHNSDAAISAVQQERSSYNSKILCGHICELQNWCRNWHCNTSLDVSLCGESIVWLVHHGMGGVPFVEPQASVWGKCQPRVHAAAADLLQWLQGQQHLSTQANGCILWQNRSTASQTIHAGWYMLHLMCRLKTAHGFVWHG